MPRPLLPNLLPLPAVRNLASSYSRVFTEHSQVNSDFEPSDFDVIGVGCDVSLEHSVQKAFSETMERFGRIDSVVASAGVFVSVSCYL